MFQYLISFFLNFWLVIAMALFVAIIVAVFRPGTRQRMDEHARIPFDEEGDRP